MRMLNTSIFPGDAVWDPKQMMQKMSLTCHVHEIVFFFYRHV